MKWDQRLFHRRGWRECVAQARDYSALAGIWLFTGLFWGAVIALVAFSISLGWHAAIMILAHFASIPLVIDQN